MTDRELPHPGSENNPSIAPRYYCQLTPISCYYQFPQESYRLMEPKSLCFQSIASGWSLFCELILYTPNHSIFREEIVNFTPFIHLRICE